MMIIHSYGGSVLCAVQFLLIIVIASGNWMERHKRAGVCTIAALVAGMMATVWGLAVKSATGAVICLTIAVAFLVLTALCRYIPALHE